MSSGGARARERATRLRPGAAVGCARGRLRRRSRVGEGARSDDSTIRRRGLERHRRLRSEGGWGRGRASDDGTIRRRAASKRTNAARAPPIARTCSVASFMMTMSRFSSTIATSAIYLVEDEEGDGRHGGPALR